MCVMHILTCCDVLILAKFLHDCLGERERRYVCVCVWGGGGGGALTRLCV